MPPRRRLFPPQNQRPLKSKGRRAVHVLTADGEVRLERKYFWSKECGGVCPADELSGVAESGVSPGAGELCCLVGVGQDFAQAADDLKRVGGLTVSKERLRGIVEGTAQQIRAVRDSGRLAPAWTAPQAKLEDGRSRVYAGIDGVMAPTVTQREKDKRRQKHVTRRRRREKTGVGNAKPLPPRRAGSDERFKEMKIGTFYDQAKQRRHTFVSEKDGGAFGKLLGAHAALIQLEAADCALSLTDGAKWIWRQVLTWLVCLNAVLLDFFHLAQHVHETARCCLGEGEAARVWAGGRLRDVKEGGAKALLAGIDALGRQVRAPQKKESVRRLRQYVWKRREMLDYPTALANGWDIGSGPTEATCKTLTLRLKRPGMKWDRDHAAGMMNLIALRESGQWKAYWAQRAAA
jgi:hypothetical protein